MARRETVVFTCDVHEGDVSEGVETVSFGLDGNAYELDACPQHRQEMQDAFSTYVGHARRATGGSGTGARRGSARGSGRASAGTGGSGGGSSDREEVQRMREWARENGHKVSERGRLSSSVIEAYRAAH
jgi:hypothetical protein